MCNASVEYSGRTVEWSEGRRGRGFDRRRGKGGAECDVFSGEWVFDNTSYPLYKESDCPYMSDQLACHKHGRSDLGFQFWRWQPHGCDLKRCDVISFLYYLALIGHCRSTSGHGSRVLNLVPEQ